MTFKSHFQPLCRTCAKPISKTTTSVYVRPERTQYDHTHPFIRFAYCGNTPPKTKDECLPYTNQQVLSVQYNADIKDGGASSP